MVMPDKDEELDEDTVTRCTREMTYTPSFESIFPNSNSNNFCTNQQCQSNELGRPPSQPPAPVSNNNNHVIVRNYLPQTRLLVRWAPPQQLQPPQQPSPLQQPPAPIQQQLQPPLPPMSQQQSISPHNQPITWNSLLGPTNQFQQQPPLPLPSQQQQLPSPHPPPVYSTNYQPRPTQPISQQPHTISHTHPNQQSHHILQSNINQIQPSPRIPTQQQPQNSIQQNQHLSHIQSVLQQPPPQHSQLPQFQTPLILQNQRQNPHQTLQPSQQIQSIQQNQHLSHLQSLLHQHPHPPQPAHFQAPSIPQNQRPQQTSTAHQPYTQAYQRRQQRQQQQLLRRQQQQQQQNQQQQQLLQQQQQQQQQHQQVQLQPQQPPVSVSSTTRIPSLQLFHSIGVQSNPELVNKACQFDGRPQMISKALNAVVHSVDQCCQTEKVFIEKVDRATSPINFPPTNVPLRRKFTLKRRKVAPKSPILVDNDVESDSDINVLE